MNLDFEFPFPSFLRGTCMNNPRKGKWFKFNDTVVEEFEMNEAALENECFGGNYKAKVFDQSMLMCLSWRLFTVFDYCVVLFKNILHFIKDILFYID